MTNREYTAAVEAGQYPEDNCVPLDTGFTNEAGLIQNLVLENFKSATVIFSKSGAVRSNHYHKTDWHYMYVLEGAMWYYWRPANSKVTPILRIFGAGEMMFTPPMVEHATFFPSETTIITFAKNIRAHEEHESDLVRVKLISVQKTDQGWNIVPC